MRTLEEVALEIENVIDSGIKSIVQDGDSAKILTPGLVWCVCLVEIGWIVENVFVSHMAYGLVVKHGKELDQHPYHSA